MLALKKEIPESPIAEEEKNSLITLKTPVLGSTVTYGELFGNPAVAARHQQPIYADPMGVIRYMCLLSEARPLTDEMEILSLKDDLARVNEEKGFIVQAGLCAEDSDTLSTDSDSYAGKFLDMMTGIKNAMPQNVPVVTIGRFAGQFAKPRSNAYEDKEKKILTFRGTNVNGPSVAERVPSIARMGRGNYFAARALDSLTKVKIEKGCSKNIYVSHEALHLANEIGFLRDGATGDVYAGSAPMIWIGERTRDPEGLHVRFASMVTNPVGLKCGPTMKPEELQELIDVLNPEKEKGKIVLIVRMGADKIDQSLPPLLKVVHENADSIATLIDPMHGNTVTDPVTGKKTRHVKTIKKEVRQFVALCLEAGVHPGGLHLEASGENVSECLGGAVCSLSENYQTLCDPCLNPAQAAGVAGEFKKTYRRLTS